VEKTEGPASLQSCELFPVHITSQ